MTTRFADRSVLITGAGSGIGRAAALAFASEGASVVVADSDRPAGEETLRDVIARGGRAIFIQTDVASEASVNNLVEQAVTAYGGVDVLHNSAGVSITGPVTEISEADWNRVHDVNLKGAFLCARAAIPQMARRGGGAIVNTSSILGIRATRRSAAYSAAEAGLVGLTRAMALDHAGQGIRVNCICAGLTDTGMARRAAESVSPGEGKSVMDSWAAGVPAGRLGTPDEIARAVLFLASDESSFINGAPLFVDGGTLAGVV